MKKNKIGRPKLKDSTESSTVSLRPSERKDIEKKFGSLTKALRSLIEIIHEKTA